MKAVEQASINQTARDMNQATEVLYLDKEFRYLQNIVISYITL